MFLFSYSVKNFTIWRNVCNFAVANGNVDRFVMIATTVKNAKKRITTAHTISLKSFAFNYDTNESPTLATRLLKVKVL